MNKRRNHLLIAGTSAILMAPLTTVSAQQDEDAIDQQQRTAVVDMPRVIVSGSDKIKLGISGQVNRGILSYDDGDDTGAIFVDNDNSSTRLRFTADTPDTDRWRFGAVVEVQFESNSTAAVDQENQRNVGPNNFTERKLEAYAAHDGLGRLTIGQGDTASNGTSEQDLSGTSVIGYSGVSDLAGGLRFRTSNGDLTDVSVGSAFSNFDGLSRDDRLRYDSPEFGGFTGAVSLIADERWDVAIRQNTDIGIVKTSFAVAYADPNDADVDSQINGSFSALFDNGMSVTLATGQDDRADRDPSFAYAKLGYQVALTSLGLSAFSVDYYNADDVAEADDESTSFGVQFVQQIDRYSTELYAGIRNYELDNETRDVDDILASLVGIRVKF